MPSENAVFFQLWIFARLFCGAMSVEAGFVRSTQGARLPPHSKTGQRLQAHPALMHQAKRESK